MSFVLIVLLCAAPLAVRSQDTCPAGCAVCCKFYCCQAGQSCCDGSCRDSCEQDKTAVWIIVGIVVAIVVALISVCLIIACIYCCSQTSQRHGTAVRSLRQPPAHVRRAYTGTNGSRSPRPQYQTQGSSQDSPRVWRTSNPSHNLRFSKHSPAFAPLPRLRRPRWLHWYPSQSSPSSHHGISPFASSSAKLPYCSFTRRP